MSVYFDTVAMVTMQVKQNSNQKVSPGGKTSGVLPVSAVDLGPLADTYRVDGKHPRGTKTQEGVSFVTRLKAPGWHSCDAGTDRVTIRC